MRIVFLYIKLPTDVFVIDKEKVELPEFSFKSVTYIQGDIIEGLLKLQRILGVRNTYIDTGGC